MRLGCKGQGNGKKERGRKRKKEGMRGARRRESHRGNKLKGMKSRDTRDGKVQIERKSE